MGFKVNMEQLVQQFTPDAAKSQVTTAMTGTKVFKKGSGADVNILGWVCIRVVPSALSSYYFNSDTTKTFPLAASVNNDICVLSNDITQVSLVLGAATASIQGM